MSYLLSYLSKVSSKQYDFQKKVLNLIKLSVLVVVNISSTVVAKNKYCTVGTDMKRKKVCQSVTSKMSLVLCVQYIQQCTVIRYVQYCILYCTTLYSMYCIQCTVYSTVCTVQYSDCTVQYIPDDNTILLLYSVQYGTVLYCTVQYSVHLLWYTTRTHHLSRTLAPWMPISICVQASYS